MTSETLVVLAVVAASASAFVTVSRGRWLDPDGSALGERPTRSPPAWVAVLTPVPGSPRLGVRLLLGVAVGWVVSLGRDLLAVPPPLLAILAGGSVFVLAGRLRPAGAAEVRAQLAAALPAICTQLAVCLEAGLPLRNAVAALAEGMTGPAAEAMRRLDASIRLGVGEADAWAEVAQRHPELADLARALRHAAGSGVSLAPVLRRLADEARAARRSTAESRARRAGVSIVLPLVVCFLPAFLLVGVVPVVGGVLDRLFG